MDGWWSMGLDDIDLMISSIISDLINTYIANNLEPTWVHVSVYGTNY